MATEEVDMKKESTRPCRLATFWTIHTLSTKEMADDR